MQTRPREKSATSKLGQCSHGGNVTVFAHDDQRSLDKSNASNSTVSAEKLQNPAAPPLSVLTSNTHFERKGDALNLVVQRQTCGGDSKDISPLPGGIPGVFSMQSKSQVPSTASQRPQAALWWSKIQSISHATVAVIQRQRERKFITCSGNDIRKRPRSSAVRDFPEGCGKSSSVCNGMGDMWGISRSHLDKAGVTTRSTEDISWSAHKDFANEKLRKEPNWAVGQEACTYDRGNKNTPLLTHGHSGFKMEREASICLYNESFALQQLQKTNGGLKRKRVSGSLEEPSVRNNEKKLMNLRQFSGMLGYGAVEGCDTPVQMKGSYSSLVKMKESPGHASGTCVDRMPKRPVGGVFLSEANGGASARSLVKQTLQEFECIRRKLANAKTGSQIRADLEAAGILKRKGRWRNCAGEKIMGEVPGVEVGDQFSFRIEMLVVGLHRQVQSGIDFIPGNRRSSGGPIATSIVASGGYEDDDDSGDTFIYTGQGGNNYKGDKRQGKDQELVRGNLALSNSYKEKKPVRVIRGRSSNSEKLYTYDGLYDVIDCWLQTGIAGFEVYQFKLTRRPGQPKLGLSIVKFVGNVKRKGLARPHLLLADISQGKERLPVCVVNEVDEEAAPRYFMYIPNMKYPSWYIPVLSQGCDCIGGCVDAAKCLCAAKNGGEFPYNETGHIIRDKKVVFECGRSCRCPSSCYNRVSQKGPRYQLEIFKTSKRGWGVRSLDSIRPGGFVCEYTGDLLSDADAEQRTGDDEYLFDIGSKRNSCSDVSHLMDVNVGNAIEPVVEDVGFTIDAKASGNVARFINHSCSPNLFAQNVLFDSDDLRFPHVMLFSMESIPPIRELAYDYNCTIGYVRDANGNVKSKACYCGAQDCRGRLY